MKQGRTLPQLAAEIERQANTKADYMVRSQNLSLKSNGVSLLRMGTDDIRDNMGELTIRDTAHAQISEHLGIPTAYYKRLRDQHPALLDSNVNTLLAARPDNERRMVRTLDGSARAFLSDRYRRIDNYELSQAILPELLGTPGLEFGSAEVTESKLYLKVTSVRLQAEVKKGDVVQMGLLISNSEIGMGSVKVEPFSMRLVCLNGMTHTDYGTRRNHVGRHTTITEETAYQMFADETLRADDQAFFLKVRDTVRHALSDKVLNSVVGQMREAAGIRIEGDPSRTVEMLAQRYRMNDDERGGILRHLIEGADLSLWGVSNAVTRMAQDVPTYDRSSELETLGGNLIALPAPEIKALVAA